ncbi:MAG: hypothetical protein ACI4JS_01590 [Oscillospiraceae bacterium]
MNYTDKELIRASQISYMDISRSVIDEVENSISILKEDFSASAIESNYTLAEMYKYSKSFRNSLYESICSKSGLDYEVAKNLSQEEILSRITDVKSKQVVAEKYDIIDDIVNGEIGKRKVVSYVDNNAIGEKGMAGKLFDGEWDHQKFSKSGDGTAVGLPLLGVSAPICAIAVLVFSLGAGIYGGKGADWLVRDLRPGI